MYLVSDFDYMVCFVCMQVVVCGAVPSMVVRSVRLYSQCSHMYVNVFPNGTVMARSDGNDQRKYLLYSQFTC